MIPNLYRNHSLEEEELDMPQEAELISVCLIPVDMEMFLELLSRVS